MKKIFVFLLIMFLSVFTISVNANTTFDNKMYVAGTGKYQITSREEEKMLAYGIKHTRDFAISRADGIASYQVGSEYDPQQVNILEIPSNGIVKIVNWTMSNPSAWSLQTVRRLAKDFEAHNPGWGVIAAVNGDFFDIKGTRALPYQTNGVSVNNGDVVRSIRSETSVGFVNNGSTNSVIGNESFEVTEEHILAIYDDSDNIIKTFTIDKLNEEPGESETSILYPYHASKNDTRLFTSPSSDSYIVASPERCYGMNDAAVFAKGEISNINEERQLFIGQFAIVTKNEEVKSYLDLGVKIRVQQDIIGAYEDCDNVTGAGQVLMYNSDGIFVSNKDRHPRTVVGQKEDGTIMLFTIDGRQPDYNMYGVTYEEMTAMLKCYGCIEGYNLDGGGSTTMITKNASGDFDVENSPSDGTERSDANALLVVAPLMNLTVQKATDSSVSLYYNSSSKDITISNVLVTIDSLTDNVNYHETKKMDNDSFVINDLPSNTEYEITYSYDIEYKGFKANNTSTGLKFSTGTKRPYVTDYYYEIVDGTYILSFNIVDDYDLASMITLSYNDEINFINKTKKKVVVSGKKVTKDISITVTYNVGAVPNSNETDTYIFEERKILEAPSVSLNGTLNDDCINIEYDITDVDGLVSNAVLVVNNEEKALSNLKGSISVDNVNLLLNSYDIYVKLYYQNYEQEEVVESKHLEYLQRIETPSFTLLTLDEQSNTINYTYNDPSNRVIKTLVVIDNESYVTNSNTYQLPILSTDVDHTIKVVLTYIDANNEEKQVSSDDLIVAKTNVVIPRSKCSNKAIVILSLLNLVSVMYILLRKRK